MIGLNKIGLNQVQLNQLYLNTLYAGQKRSAGGDGFPRLPGDVTRWHFGGLTNEMMAAMDDPRLEDADHKGRFLSFKNFVWDGMSGCDGYTESFLGDKINWESEIYNSRKMSVFGGDRSKVSIIHNQYHFQTYVKISGIDDNEGKVRGVYFYNLESSFTEGTLCRTDGIYKIDITELNKRGVVGIWAYPAKKNEEDYDYPVTIEILPLYPGFILGDGVDDFAVTEKELNFEDTYTVYTAFIPFETSTKYPALCGKDYKKDFYINYLGDDLSKASFYSSNKLTFIPMLNGFNILCCKRTPDKIVIKNLITGKLSEASVDALIDNPGTYYLWRSLVAANYAKAAIAGQTICNGHFSTDEEDEKVLKWYKKEYPWLFFDQAWTVTGKTNEDEDRATIANITGNGNNLVLSNFGFAGNSGYGEYAYNWNTWKINKVNSTKSNVYHNRMEITLPAIGESSYTRCDFYSPLYEVGTIYDFSFKISGLTDNSTVFVKPGTYGGGAIIAQYNKDGVYHLNYTLTDAAIIDESTQNRIYFFIQNFSDEEMNLTVEQIPDHEGYLVTDGVDDKIASSAFETGKDFTVVGEWKLLPVSSYNYAGIVKSNNLYVYNNASIGFTIFIRSGGSVANKIEGIKSLKAICSDGRVYGEDWTEYKLNPGTTAGLNTALNLGFNGSNFTQMAFKNLGIYNNQILSKDDCIKAYNHLQTLKAK